ncbi:ABC transporter permease [Micromonospora aurantiaca]|uniref:ABC transporter permease n=1 Tax=Micromonospora aurantiaca (nom. illeg.) TaxID=47850 RepID=A0A6N3JY60_9ACTN|nr:MULTISPECIES: ABC transporter permease [Micromonospora]ADL44531.1 binding-protein-dependent transport systems inner membrane component [Micromonospora aurantiaca ATCC 27029]ADU06754.1 binding-protein-dependent transport systems inner membrane component [Micromonospora sp. L5]AXH90735.1 ABC transporter permease [Micromonospora aurantiaca]KAB1117089.1 ABC transporter permease [Micromonospora aurantiaca]MDG4749498.1 ABC transporter permease [Micromonospora sp. WMMD718]
MNGLRRWLADRWVMGVALLVLGYLTLPIMVVAGLSFNRPSSRLSYDFNEFTLDNWKQPCATSDMCDAVVRSMQIGLIATVVSTLLGTLMAFALVRHSFRGRSGLNGLIFLPMATPELVMGTSLLALFVAAGVPQGFWTIVIAHVMFCVSFVVVTVKARLSGMDRRLEEAAMDLYASEWQTFRRITLPLVLPGIVAAALLAFSLSFDDFIITNFNAGTTVTFPMYVWGASQRGIPPQVNVIGTAMFVIALLLVGATSLRGRRARRAALAMVATPAGKP